MEWQITCLSVGHFAHRSLNGIRFFILQCRDDALVANNFRGFSFFTEFTLRYKGQWRKEASKEKEELALVWSKEVIIL